jgi:hypothetical protein
MDFIFLLVAVFLIGNHLFKSLGISLFSPKKDYDFPKTKDIEPSITVNNYTTEQHLHISKEDLERLINENKENG